MAVIADCGSEHHSFSLLSVVCFVGMKFPVDLLTDVCQEELEQSAQNYMNNLLYSSPDSPEHLTFSDSTQVKYNTG